MAEYKHIYHTFEPVYNKDSKILILGSFPSVKSREQGFYYGHARDRFWKVLSELLSCKEPLEIEEKKEILLKHHIAIWDVIDSCDIKGSSDSSIRNVVPADISSILKQSSVQKIYANGKTAGKLYQKYIQPNTNMGIEILPSTSPANAACSLEDLQNTWRIILKGLE